MEIVGWVCDGQKKKGEKMTQFSRENPEMILSLLHPFTYYMYDLKHFPRGCITYM